MSNKELIENATEFEASGMDKDSQVYKDTKQAIDGEIDAVQNDTGDKLVKLQKTEKALIDKANKVKNGLKNDTSNELAKINIELQVAQLDPFAEELEELKEKYNDVVYDLDDPKQDKAARSNQRLFGSFVSKLDKKYSEISEPINECRNQLLHRRKAIKDDARETQGKIKSQIESHETAKREHLEMLESKLEYITLGLEFAENVKLTSKDYKERIGNVLSIKVDASYEHLQQQADDDKQSVLNKLENLYDETLQQEKDAKELEDLRAKQTIQDQKDRDDKIRAEAADSARIEAEEQANLKIKQAEAESLRIKNENAQALINAENEKKQAVENERLRIEKEFNEQQKLVDAEVAIHEKKKAASQHRRKIHKQAKDALVKNGFDCETATKIVTLIKDNMIDNLTVEY